MSRRQTRLSSRSRDELEEKAGKSSPRTHSPARSLDPHRDQNLPVRSAKQVRVTLTRLEIAKVDSSYSSNRTYNAEETEQLMSNGSPTQLSLRSLKSRRSIRTMSSSFVKAEQAEHRTPRMRTGIKTTSQSAGEGSPRRVNAYTKVKADLNSSEPQEWAGSFGATLLTLTAPICIPLLQVACTNDHCGSQNFHIPNLTEWLSYFDRDAFLFYAGYLCYVAIMSLLPIGKVIAVQQSKGVTQHRRINGLWTLIVGVSIFAAMVSQGYPVEEYLIKNSLKLTLVGLVYGLVLSIVLYIKANWAPSSNINAYGSTNSFIYNFWQGREINPRLGPVDVKQVLFKSTVIGTDLINLAAAVKILKEVDSFHWDNLSNLNIAALAVISLQTIFFVDKLIFEDRFLSSFEMNSEGLGYLLSIGYLIYPYISTLSARYLLVHRVELPMYLIVIWTIVFFVGYWLYRGSNNQKDEFRRDPFSPAVAHLETIPTPAGKRLLVSGFWGYVRRPNYLGDILMHLAWAFLGFAPDIMPYVLTIFTTVLLIHRAIRDEARCEKRYRFAWNQYCQRVKYIIFPPVF